MWPAQGQRLGKGGCLWLTSSLRLLPRISGLTATTTGGLSKWPNVRLLYERPRAATCTDIWKWGSDRAAVRETNIITGGSRGDFVVAGPDGCASATQSSSVEKLVRTNGTCSYYQSSCDRQTPENATDCGKTPRPRRQLEPWGKRCSGNGEVGRR